MTPFSLNVGACHRCINSRGLACAGACPCPIDGRDVALHARAGFCPDPNGAHFGDAAKPPGWDELPTADPTQAPPREYRPAPPIPYAEWPRKIKAVAKFRRPEDTGAGDTLARLFNVLPAYKGLGAGDAFKKFMEWVGIDCGCTLKQRRMNERYSYAEQPRA